MNLVLWYNKTNELEKKISENKRKTTDDNINHNKNVEYNKIYKSNQDKTISCMCSP